LPAGAWRASRRSTRFGALRAPRRGCCLPMAGRMRVTSDTSVATLLPPRRSRAWAFQIGLDRFRRTPREERSTFPIRNVFPRSMPFGPTLGARLCHRTPESDVTSPGAVSRFGLSPCPPRSILLKPGLIEQRRRRSTSATETRYVDTPAKESDLARALRDFSQSRRFDIAVSSVVEAAGSAGFAHERLSARRANRNRPGGAESRARTQWRVAPARRHPSNLTVARP